MAVESQHGQIFPPPSCTMKYIRTNVGRGGRWLPARGHWGRGQQGLPDHQSRVWWHRARGYPGETGRGAVLHPWTPSHRCPVRRLSHGLLLNLHRSRHQHVKNNFCVSLFCPSHPSPPNSNNSNNNNDDNNKTATATTDIHVWHGYIHLSIMLFCIGIMSWLMVCSYTLFLLSAKKKWCLCWTIYTEDGT